MKYFKTAAAAFLVLAAASLASTAQPGQSHNLSEIHPIDTDFNMSGYQIFNVSHYELQDGLNFSGYSIYDQGNVELLSYDEGNSEWVFQNSNISLEGNQISNIGGFSQCSPGQFLTGNGSCSTASGDGYLPDDPADSNVNMSGHNITSHEEICVGDQC